MAKNTIIHIEGGTVFINRDTVIQGGTYHHCQVVLDIERDDWSREAAVAYMRSRTQGHVEFRSCEIITLSIYTRNLLHDVSGKAKVTDRIITHSKLKFNQPSWTDRVIGLLGHTKKEK